MKCIPSGVPDKYMFRDWEHTTEYNDHIRYLPITKEGNTATLNIPKILNKRDHQDRGLYICRASNNISSTNGMFVMRKYNLKLNGEFFLLMFTCGKEHLHCENNKFIVGKHANYKYFFFAKRESELKRRIVNLAKDKSRVNNGLNGYFKQQI